MARAVSGVAVGLFFGGLAMGGWAVVGAAAVLLASGLTAGLAVRKIGGVSGDVLGAAEVVGETLVLLGAAALTHRGVAWPWWR